MSIPIGWILGLLALIPRKNPDPLGFGLEEPDKPSPPGSPPPAGAVTQPAPTKPSTITPDKVPPIKVTTQPSPWPAAKPAGLAKFPGPEWVYDEPPPKAVQARAMQLLPTLHARGVGSHTTEFIDGRWISFLARMNQNMRAVEAYRLRTAPKVVPVKPGAKPPVKPAASHPDVVMTSTPVQKPTAPPGGVVAPPSSSSSAPAGPVPPTVMLGSKGPNVEKAQRLLGVVMKPGNPYGTFGEYTRQAAITYQQSHGLQPDGVVGPATWSSLLYGSAPAPSSAPPSSSNPANLA